MTSRAPGYFAAAPAVASAALEIKSAALDGVQAESGPPGSVFTATVVGAETSDQWRGTEYRFDKVTTKCGSGSGSSRPPSAKFDVAAPGDPGEYDVGFVARANSDCSGTGSVAKVLQGGMRVTDPGPNPDLPPRCGINVMLVLDKSGSIQSSGQTETVREATRAFLEALSGTGAKVSIVDFSSTAARPIDYTTVTPTSIADTFEPYLVNDYKPSGFTNWQAAYDEVGTANANTPLADLVVFITDGDPTAYTKAGGGAQTGLTEGAVAAMRPAAFEADGVKNQGSHVFALGVGAAVTKPASAHRLTAISGFDQYPDVAFGRADYTLVQDFDDLANALKKIALELCEASVTVTKFVDEGDGVYKPDPGWTFDADVTMSEGTYRWLQPAPPPVSGARSATTDSDGVASFQWKASDANASSTLELSEQQQPGYEFVDATCERVGSKRRRRVAVPVGSIKLLPGEYAKCAVHNRVIPGTIEIEKQANPKGDTPFPFTGTLGEFSLVDDGSGAGSSRTFTDLAPGSYTVSELVPENWELSGVTCTPAGAAATTGPETVITLAAGGAVVCSYANTRTEPPVPPIPPIPPVPPTPPTPPNPPTPGGGVLPFVTNSTTLRVVKRAPRSARIGDRIRFSLTVTNTGTTTAHRVRLADIPPAAVELSGLSSQRRARIIRGNALWRFGVLEPGQSRTVRGSVRIERSTPGWKRNRVVATAIDAPFATAHADTRVRLRALPRFTG